VIDVRFVVRVVLEEERHGQPNPEDEALDMLQRVLAMGRQRYAFEVLRVEGKA